jgi:ABC-type uncharacterized transport system substrate-binding protein
LAALKLRLQELGWTEGKNLRIDVRFGNNNSERIRQAATELIEAAPDAITSTTSTTTLALMPALAKARNEHASAIIVAADPLTIANGRAIIEGCESLKLPAMHTFAFETKNGALMSYGIDIVASYRRTAEYIDRILKGTKIADLPFQEPTRLTLAINLQTARAIGIEVPRALSR